jgi:hypothetical protein
MKSSHQRKLKGKPFRLCRSSIRKLHEGFSPKKVKAAFMTLPQLQNQGSGRLG